MGKESKMANVIIGKIEIALEDVAHWLKGVGEVVLKGPAIVTALGVLFAQLDKVISDVEVDVANPLAIVNVGLTNQTLTDLKDVWADVKAVFAAAGVKI